MKCRYCKGSGQQVIDYFEWGTEYEDCYYCGGSGKTSFFQWFFYEHWDIGQWLTRPWYEYLLARRTDYQRMMEIPWYTIAICRARNHPEGSIYYNPGGLEPDPHCRTCGDEIG